MRIDADTHRLLFLDAFGMAPPDGARQRIERVFAHAKHFSHVAQGRTRTIGNHCRRETGAIASIAVVDILHHLLAPLMLEIDVDIRRFAAFG